MLDVCGGVAQGGLRPSAALDKALALVNSTLTVSIILSIPVVAPSSSAVVRPQKLGGKRVVGSGSGLEAAICAAVVKGVETALKERPWEGRAPPKVKARVEAREEKGWRVAVCVGAGSDKECGNVHTECSRQGLLEQHVTHQLDLLNMPLRDNSVLVVSVTESASDALALLRLLFCALLASAPTPSALQVISPPPLRPCP